MKIASSTWILASLLAVSLKLFTYEYYLPDDPTCGLAARSRPSPVNHQVLNRSDLVLVTDENDFPGSSLYNATVAWGILAILASGPAVFFLQKRRSSKPQS